MMRGMAPRAKASLIFTRAERAAKFILSKTRLRPKIGLVLGSGLGAFAEELRQATRIPYQKIPAFPRSTAVGHAGELVIGKVGEVPVAVMSGRVHFYEGYSLQEVTLPMRVFGRMGIQSVILTNAAGGINRQYSECALVLVRDHLNLQGANPLLGPNEDRFGARFPDMTRAYSQRFRDIAREEGQRLGIPLHEGVYACLSGPSYETPAEIRYLETIGADMVGMSTVPEVIVARQMGIEVVGISCVTNMAAGILDKPIHHEEVLEAGARVRDQFVALLKAVIPRMARVSG
jgi:purine-nucleoside phosphorylase